MVLTVPADAIAAEQIDYLKAFAIQNAQERRKQAAEL
jgi:hypothetical protein